MPTKQQLLDHIDKLRSLIASEESDSDAKYWYTVHFRRPFYEDERLLDRLQRIEGRLKELLSRPGATCQLKGEADAEVARLIVGMGPTARQGATLYLEEQVAGATQLTICDPYLLQPYANSPADDYVNSLVNVLPDGLKTLELFVKPRVRNREVAEKFTALCRQRGIRMSVQRTDLLHDRVWIVDHEHAYAVGTSFNGLGNRCSFILPLPQEDRRAYLRELAAIRGNATRSRSA